MNSSLHSSPQDAPVHPHRPHLTGAGYLTLSPLSFFEWDEKSNKASAPASPLSPSAMGSFVNKAKAILKVKRTSWQLPSSPESTFAWPGVHRTQTLNQPARPGPRRQSTAPLLTNHPISAVPSRASRRRTGGSMQIGQPMLIESTMFPEFARDASPIVPRCSPTPPPLHTRHFQLRELRDVGICSPTEELQSPTDTLRALCGESDPFPRSVSGPTVGRKPEAVTTLREHKHGSRLASLGSSSGIFNKRSRVLEGLDLGVSETMVAISEAGLFHDLDASNEQNASMLFEALSKMLASCDDSEGDPNAESDAPHDIIGEYLDFGQDTPLLSEFADERGDPTSVSSSSPPCHPMAMDRCLEHMTASPPGSLLTPWRALQPVRSHLEIKSLKGPQVVEIIPNEACVVELHAIIAESSSTTSRSQSLLTAPPAVPARSPRRPISRSSSYASECSVTPVPVVPVPGAIPVLATGNRKQSAHDMSIRAQGAHVMKGSHTAKKERKGRSRSRLAKMRVRPSNHKLVAEPSEWIVVSTLSASGSGSSQSLYASSSSSTRLRTNKAPRPRARIVKSPSIRSGLARRGGSGRCSSRSRGSLRASGVLTSAVPTLHSTRSLPGQSNSNSKGKSVQGFPSRPRSRARPKLVFAHANDKENLSVGRQIGSDPSRESDTGPLRSGSRVPLGGGLGVVAGNRNPEAVSKLSAASRRPILARNPTRTMLRARIQVS